MLPSLWVTTYLSIYWWILTWKSTEFRSRPRPQKEQGKPGKYELFLQHGGNGSSYQDGIIDFFGLVVLPLRTIYLVIDGRSLGRSAR